MKKYRFLTTVLSAALGLACIAAPFPANPDSTLTASAASQYYTNADQLRFKFDTVTREAAITGYFGYEEELVVPSAITVLISDTYELECTVTKFSFSGYYETYEGEPGNVQQIKKITIPGTIKSFEYGFQSIGYSEGWNSLEEIVFEEGVESLGFGIFYNAKGVRRVTIPSTVTYIDSDAFAIDSMYSTYADKGGVILGYDGTTAEKFAKFNKIPFISLGEAPAAEPVETTTEVPETTTEAPETTTETTIITTATTTTATTELPVETLPALSIAETAVTLQDGEQYTITANQENVTYKSNNTDVAVVSKSGIVTALGEGNAVISVINSDGDVVQMKVTVTPFTNPQTTVITAPATEEMTTTETTIITESTTETAPATQETTTSITEATTVKSGDITGDEDIDIRDVILLNQSIFGKVTLTEEQRTAADINGDGMPDAEDALLIMKYIVKLIDTL